MDMSDSLERISNEPSLHIHKVVHRYAETNSKGLVVHFELPSRLLKSGEIKMCTF